MPLLNGIVLLNPIIRKFRGKTAGREHNLGVLVDKSVVR